MNARQQILLDYEDLPEGESRAGELCPACEGGGTRERTLSVSRTSGRLVWMCHRASCQFKGVEVFGGIVRRPESGPVAARGVWGRRIDEGATALPASVRKHLAEAYCITDKHVSKHGLGWDTESRRITFPVKDFLGHHLGVTLRALDSRKPKSQSHTEKDAIAWYVNHSPTIPGVIIVEDQLSAIRASDYLTSVALLGTHLNEERVGEIRAAKMRPVYLALDADAWAKSVKYAVEYRSALAPKLVKLTKDIKNLDDSELSSLITGLIQPEGML